MLIPPVASTRQLYEIDKGENVCSEYLKEKKRKGKEKEEEEEKKKTVTGKMHNCRSLMVPMFCRRVNKGGIDKGNKS